MGRTSYFKTKKRGTFSIRPFIIIYILLELLALINGHPFAFTRFLYRLFYTFFYVIFTTDDVTAVINMCYLMVCFLLVMAVSIGLLLSPYIIFKVAIGGARRGNYRGNRTFKSSGEIEYFREQFGDVTPTTLSLLMDLEIETEKDISAVLLSMYHKNQLIFENGEPKFVGNTNDLSDCDYILLRHLMGPPPYPKLQEWEQRCINEAISEGYIKMGINVRGFFRFMIMGAILCLCATLILTSVIKEGSIVEYMETLQSPEFEAWANGVQRNFKVENIALILADSHVSNMITPLVAMCKVIVCAFIIFIMPAAMMMYISLFFLVGKRFKRTDKGNMLTEQLAGMREFIRDFSILDEATKDYVRLWGNFLVYAVVLEENEQIVDEISQEFGKDYWSVCNYINNRR